MFIIFSLSQSILLVLFTKINRLKVIIGIWFVYELVSNIIEIYSRDTINRNLFTNIGKRLSKFRISIAIESILGQIVVSQIWDKIGVNEIKYSINYIINYNCIKRKRV